MLPSTNNEYFWNNDPFTRLFNQNFGTGHHQLPATMPTLPNSYWARHHQHRPRRPAPPPPSPPMAPMTSTTPPKDGLWTSLNLNRDKFELLVDVHHFLPEEIKIKTADNHIIIEGNHEEKEDSHGFITRSFSRRYALPENVKIEHIICNLSSDGVLMITVPRLELEDPNVEKLLPITQTGKPAAVHVRFDLNSNLHDTMNKERERHHTPHCEQNGEIHENGYGFGHLNGENGHLNGDLNNDICESKI